MGSTQSTWDTHQEHLAQPLSTPPPRMDECIKHCEHCHRQCLKTQTHCTMLEGNMWPQTTSSFWRIASRYVVCLLTSWSEVHPAIIWPVTPVRQSARGVLKIANESGRRTR